MLANLRTFIAPALLFLGLSAPSFAVPITYGPGAGFSIADGGDLTGTLPGTSSTSIVAPAGIVGSLINVQINISTQHTFRSDVEVMLLDPNGNSATLFPSGVGGAPTGWQATTPL